MNQRDIFIFIKSSFIISLLLNAYTVVCNGDDTLENGKSILSMFKRNTSTTTTERIPPRLRTCDCVCGERNEASRIVGGVTTESNEFPWMVRLSYFNRFYCGGMLINDKYVLTAAHCVRGLMWFMIKVTLGEHNRCTTSPKPETRFVIRAITDDHYDGMKAITTGWGTLKEDGTPSCLLQEVEVPVMSNEDCRANTSYHPKMISDNMMCAGYEEGLKDSCQGDSGGPLIRERGDKRYELIGVVSWGNGCARPGFPGVYTRVARYLNWIVDHSSDGCFCEE
ncbi:trypsin-7-like isoform X2 [Rhodnius prolixus]|uniref:trypsin-7-like isoform X2 n=1 Tax=Rhodnius prolixus TaxID=13249 RepID=UPI003D189171